jgi:hypothetical protein
LNRASEPLVRSTVDAHVYDGQPCVRGLRIPVSIVLKCLAAGKSPAEIVGGGWADGDLLTRVTVSESETAWQAQRRVVQRFADSSIDVLPEQPSAAGAAPR